MVSTHTNESCHTSEQRNTQIFFFLQHTANTLQHNTRQHSTLHQHAAAQRPSKDLKELCVGIFFATHCKHTATQLNATQHIATQHTATQRTTRTTNELRELDVGFLFATYCKHTATQHTATQHTAAQHTATPHCNTTQLELPTSWESLASGFFLLEPHVLYSAAYRPNDSRPSLLLQCVGAVRCCSALLQCVVAVRCCSALLQCVVTVSLYCIPSKWLKS